MRWLAVAVLLATTPAHADDSLANWLIGPLVGVQLSGPHAGGAVLGLEGGGGYGPERFNLGFEHRGDLELGYIEVDPWFFVGGTLGVGVQSDGKVEPVLGLWEGLPLVDPSGCNGQWHQELTISGGYRYTGEHELYATVKAGYMEGNLCFN